MFGYATDETRDKILLSRALSANLCDLNTASVFIPEKEHLAEAAMKVRLLTHPKLGACSNLSLLDGHVYSNNQIQRR
jgi:hypothetical protein